MVRALLTLAATVSMGAAPAASTTARAEEIDRVVAVIQSAASTEARVITLSRLEDETRIALVSRGGLLAATERLDDSALAAGLQWIVDETLLMDEARRLQVFDGDAAPETADDLARFRARFHSPSDYQAFLSRWNLSEDDVATVLRRTARVKRYVDTRASHAAQVSESEVDAWVAAHPTSSGGAPDRAAARARLVDERVAAEVKALVRDLRSRAEVRFLAFHGPATGEVR